MSEATNQWPCPYNILMPLSSRCSWRTVTLVMCCSVTWISLALSDVAYQLLFSTSSSEYKYFLDIHFNHFALYSICLILVRYCLTFFFSFEESRPNREWACTRRIPNHHNYLISFTIRVICNFCNWLMNRVIISVTVHNLTYKRTTSHTSGAWQNVASITQRGS